MPPPKRKELTPSERLLIIDRYHSGEKKSSIHRELNIPYSTVVATIAKFESTKTCSSARRSGRPKVISDADTGFIFAQIKRNPRISIKEICRIMGGSVSEATVARKLKQAGYRHGEEKRKHQIGEEKLD